jgi:carboxypeptidase C (cathepsin A)
MSDPEQTQEKKTPEQPAKPEPKDVIVETRHTIVINGEEIAYTALAGTLILKEESEKEGEAEGEKPRAAIFFVAYLRDDVQDRSKRPITFSFNGGPGSSSVWLHLGVLGPRRVLMDAAGGPLPPPHQLVDNIYSPLDVTDLVFIDPVSTGFSRAVVGEKAQPFHGFKKDIESVGDFIRLFVTRYRRWSSPKFLIGESYGTTRSAGLSGYLQDHHNMYLNGIMLVSSVLDFATLDFNPGNELPYIFFLPTYTATAWYHRRLATDLQENFHAAITEARQFALGEYTTALMKGNQLSDEEHEHIRRRLARLTGLSEQYCESSHLRINIFQFCKELLRDEQRTVGRLDSRFTGIDRDSVGGEFEYDPSLTNIMGPYTSAFNSYVREELNYESDLYYATLSRKVHPWSYAEHENQYVYVAETLRQALTINPYLRVHVFNGYFDLATPFLATEYTFSHLGLDSSLQNNIQMSYYEAGHMMYIHQPSLERMKTELNKFITQG